MTAFQSIVGKMKKDFDIYKTLVASTSHIKKNDLETLVYFEKLYNNPNLTPHSFSLESNCGTRVYLYDGIMNDVRKFKFSEGFLLLVLFSVSNGCSFLEIDCDGAIYDEIPKYAW